MNALKETKKKHLLAILKYLYLHNSSTMNELVGNLQLSQPSIRNMVRILQEKQLIQEVGNDLSSGGRCPTRFALNEKNYLILCLYIQVDKIIYQVRGFSEIKKEDTLFYQGEEELKKIIRQLVDKNEVHCCQIAVEGIVYEDEYVTDHQNILKKHHWVKDIKKEIDLPIQLQNDVKMIHQGCYFTYQQDTTYYLYINDVGIGSSYFYKDEPLYGNTGIMGEIGLISFKGKTINQRIRECQSQDEFNELLGLLVSMIFTMLDPTRLELSLDLKWNYEEKIIKNILNKIDKKKLEELYKEVIPLAEVCSVVNESVSVRANTIYNYLEVLDISPQTGSITNVRKVSGKEIGDSFHLFYGGDILFTRINPRINRVAIAPPVKPFGIMSKEIYRILYKKNKYISEENRYVICAILQNEWVIKQIIRLSTGSSSSRARVQVEDLLNDVYIPVLDEKVQKEISDSTYSVSKKLWNLSQKILKSYVKNQKILGGDVDKDQLRGI